MNIKPSTQHSERDTKAESSRDHHKTSNLGKTINKIAAPLISSSSSSSGPSLLVSCFAKIGISQFELQRIKSTLNQLQQEGTIVPFELNGKETNIAVISRRPIVLAKVSNHQHVPFYISTGTGHKHKVPKNHWYPFFGLATAPIQGQYRKHWFIKGHDQITIANFYNNKNLKTIAKALDSRLGNIRSNCPPEWEIPENLKDEFQNMLNSKIENGVAPRRPLARNDLDDPTQISALMVIEQILNRL